MSFDFYANSRIKRFHLAIITAHLYGSEEEDVTNIGTTDGSLHLIGEVAAISLDLLGGTALGLITEGVTQAEHSSKPDYSQRYV